MAWTYLILFVFYRFENKAQKGIMASVVMLSNRRMAQSPMQTFINFNIF
jgi:hypothetical protein